MTDISNSYGPRGAVPKAYRTFPSREPAAGRSFAQRGANAVRRWLTEGDATPEQAGSERDELLEEIVTRRASVEDEMARRRELFRRFDNFYHPNSLTLGGADHWSEDPSAMLEGRAHISVNAHPAYVTIPASLQAVTPVINVVPKGPSKAEREAATRVEDLYFEWREQIGYELLDEDVCLIKALYGDTAAKVYWDPERRIPTVEVIESPENLYLGYGSSDYRRIDWALYRMSMSPQAIREEFGLDVEMEKDGDGYKPVVYYVGDHSDPLNQSGLYGQKNIDDIERSRRDAAYERCQLEVLDYWYKTPAKKAGGAPIVWNVIYVGDVQAKPPTKHLEYGGELPYVPIINQRVPGSPYGKPELYDVEQLLRDKDERITDGAAMIHGIAQGQRWQLVGENAPDEIGPNVLPQPNKVGAPGPGNELKALQPFIPQFAIEDHNKRIDRELAVVSGLNDLLLGLAPPQVLGSSRAISALVANYESRINPKRKLKYDWDKRVWRLAARIWEKKDKSVRDLIDGNYRLEIKAPELTPRDALEIANTAISLQQNRIWSMERAMDATGVEDVTDEKAIIREEQTDATLQPASVQAQAQLMAVLGQLAQQGLTPPGSPGNPQPGGQAQSQNTARTLQRPARGSDTLNQEENQGQVPLEALPANAQPGGSGAEAGLTAQTLLQEGEAKSRILSETQL